MDRKQSFEDYLETILEIEEEKGEVRSIDIAKKLNFSRASVSTALKKLDKEGYLKFDHESYDITLTEKGRKLGEYTLYKHRTITKFFVAIGVSQKTAEHDACEIEHRVSEETFSKFVDFIKKD